MKYLIELAVRDYYFSTQRASTVALAAIFNAISDTRSTEERKVLGAFLRVTMECFDFDHPNQIAAARSKLQSSETLKFDVEDERSLDDSMKTFKVSNRSSAREIVGSFLVERNE